jgi:HEAT repeat protein
MALHQALKDDDAESQAAVAEAMWRIDRGNRDQVVTALTEMLKDKARSRRVAAAEVLGRIGKDAAAAVPTLVLLVRDRDWQVREKAAAAMKKIDPDAAVKAKVS